uniref:Uncharacterized protein n=1 Tax=Arundo donax TaxID=35708 RepID=A0A0A8ZKP4_ARUDO
MRSMKVRRRRPSPLAALTKPPRTRDNSSLSGSGPRGVWTR